MVFGDRVGYTLFLGALVLFVCYWRIGVYINDTETVLNTLVAVERGTLHLDTAQYGGLGSPGTHVVDGVVYGRNYGQVFLALPFLIALRGLSAAVYPSVAIVAGWSLLLLALSRSLAGMFDRPTVGTVGGCVLALVAFSVGVATAYPMAPDRLPIVALQLTSMALTAYAVVLIYRLASTRVSHRAGIVVGVAYAAVLPTAFWASIPKRHALTTALLFASLYLLFRSRHDDMTEALRYRAGAYVPIGLTAWVHAPEGFLLLVGVGVADVVTARSNTARQLTVVAGTLTVSLLPFFLTNLLVSGNPIHPPRFTPAFDGTVTTVTATLDAAGDEVFAGEGFRAVIDSVLPEPIAFLERFASGLAVVVSEPTRVVDTFVLSEGFDSADRNMSVLESAPVLGVLLGSLAGVRGASVRGTLLRLRSVREWDTVDLAAVIYAPSLVLLYMPSLPLHAQITVRYLLPLYPLALLAVVRTSAVRSILDGAWRTLLWTYVAGALLGSQLLLAAVVLVGTTLEDAMRLESHLALGIAAVLAAWTLAYSLGMDSERSVEVGAVLLGLAAAAGTAFLLVSAWWYFPYGPFALPFVPRP